MDDGEHVRSLAKDWLHLRPPSPSSSLGWVVDLEDKLVKLPFSRNLVEKDFFYSSSSTWPSTMGQGLSSSLDGDIPCVNGDSMPFERIIGLTPHKPEISISITDANPCSSNQVDHLSAGNGYWKHPNESYDVAIGKFPLTSQEELLHQEVDSGNSSERSMLVEMAEESWQDGFDRGIQADHLYLGFTYPSCKKFSNNNDREIFEADDKEPCNQLQVMNESLVSSSEEIPSFAVHTTVLLDSNLPTGPVSFSSSYSTACLGGESKSKNLSVPICQLANMHDLKADFCLSSTESLTISMENKGNSIVPDMNGIAIDAKLQNPSITHNRIVDPAVPFYPLDGLTDVKNNMTEQIALSTTLLSIVSDYYANYAPQKSQSVIESARNQELRGFNSFSRVGGNDFNIRGTVDDLCIPVQYDFLPTDISFFPVGIEDQVLPKSKLPSLSLHEGMGFGFTPQVTEGAVRCKTIGLHKESNCLVCTSDGTSCDKFCQCGCAYAWPPRIVDEKFRKDSNTVEEYAICHDLGCSREMYALEQLKEADDILAGRKVIANLSSQEFKHYSENLEPRKCRSYFADSVIDCHTLVENIQNSSLLLIASHSSESDRLVEADVQALLSVIDNLSHYLMDRAGVSASSIQATIKPVKDHSGSNSRICEKVFKWTEEKNAEDYGIQASMLSDKISTSRGINFFEGGRCSTQILAKSQGTDYKKMGKFSCHEKDKFLERRLSELQKQVKKLREDVGFELKEMDTAINFYENLLREYKAVLSNMMSEIEHITELQFLKQNKFRTDAQLFDARGKMSENTDGKMLKTSREINLKPRENVTVQVEISEERDPEDSDRNTNLISAMNTVSPINAEGDFRKPVAVLHSHLESLGKTSEIRGITGSDCSVVVDSNPTDVADNAVKLLSFTRDCKNAKIKENQISVMNDTPQAHYEDSLWKQAEISMFWEGSRQESDTRKNLKFCNHDVVGVSPEIETREEILRRFKLLEECNHLHMRKKNSEKQFGKAIIDEPSLWKNSLFNENSIDEPSLCKNSLFHGNSVDNSYPRSSEQEDNQSRQDEGTYLNPETHFLYLDRSLRKGETSEIKDKTKYMFSPEVDWKLKGNVDQTAIPLSREKLCETHETQTNLNQSMNVTPQTDDKQSIWDRAVILFSRDERLGDPSISRNMNVVDNDTLYVIAKSDSMHNEEIPSRFRSLSECNKSGLMARASSAVQSDEANVNVSGCCNYSNLLEENEVDSSYSESYESLQCGDNFREWATFFPSQEEKLREGEFSDIGDQTNSTCSIMVDSNLEQVRDCASILLSHEEVCENPKTNTYLNCLVNITPEGHYEGSICNQASILFSREESCGESERCRDEITCNHDSMEREEILHRFKVLQECRDQSDTTQRGYGEQLSVAIIDKPRLCKNSLFHENSVDHSYPKSSESNQEDNQSRQDEGTYLKLETYFLSLERSLRKGETSESNQEDNQSSKDEGTFLNLERFFLSLERSLRKGETSEIKDKTNYKFSPEVDWKLKGNVDQTAIPLSCGKLCESHETQTNLNLPVNVTPQTDYKQSIWDRAGILFSREERLGDPYKSRNMNAVYNDTLDQDVIAKSHSMHNEEIPSKFRSLLECNKSGLMARVSSAVQSDEATVNVSGSYNYSFHLEENEVDSSYSESYESLQDGDNFREWATFLPYQEEKLREGEFSDIGDKTNSTCSIKVDSNLEQVGDCASILLSREKVCENPKIITYLDCLVNITPESHYEGSIWDPAAILFSSEESCGEFERCRDATTCDHDAMEREEILRRLKVLQECSDQSDTTQRDYEEQLSKAIIYEPSLFKNSLFHGNSVDKSYPNSSESNQEDNQSRQDEGTCLNPETYFLSLDRSLRKDETSEIRDETNSKFSPEVAWKLEGNVDQTAILLSCGNLCESHETQTKLNHPMNVTPQTDYKQSIWDRAVILFSREERLVDSSISRNMNVVDNDTLDVIAMSHSMHNEEIHSRFRSLPECNKSGLIARASSAVQSDEATVNVSGSCNYSFHLEESEVDSSYSESYESLQGGENFREWATCFPSQEEKLREGEFSDIGDQTNSTCSIKVDSNLEQVRDRAAILLSREKVCENPKTNTYLNCLVNISTEAHCEDSIWDRAAILFSREESCGESERNRDEITGYHDAMEREEIFHRFEVLHGCSDQSDTTKRDYGEQLSDAIIDEPGLSNYFLHLKEITYDKSNSESHKSIQEHSQAFHAEELANQSAHPDSNEGQACHAILYHWEASGDGIEDDQPIVASRSFEKQTSSLHESEPEGNCDIPESPYFTRQSSHSHLELKIPVSFRMEQLVLPSIESYFEESKLIRNMSENYQSEPSSLIQTSDVAVGSQSKYFYNDMTLYNSKSDSNQDELINTNAMEYSARERSCDNVFKRDHSSQTLSPTSSILKLVSDTSNIVTGNKNQNCRNRSRGNTDAESLDQEELNCSPQHRYDIGQHTFYNELESSSTESESSWEYVEMEEDIAFQ